jgi:pimeloyl-ACP methyl ester carboxylesterase
MKVRSSHRIVHLFSKRALFLALIPIMLLAAPARSSELTSRFAEFDGNKVHYQTSGKGKEALIFVHGWTCNGDFWRGQTSAFTGTRVIAVDLPGHGRSDKPQTDYTMAYFARSIEAVMRDARVTRAVLVGHSMGTPIIRQFYRLYPEKTLALVIVDGGLRPFATKEQTEQFTKMLRTNYKVVAQPMLEGMLRPVKDEKLKAEIRTAMQATPEHVAVSAMVSMADEKIYEKDPIKVPVLAVLAKSPFWPADTEQFLRALAPNLDFYMWDDVSHFLMMEKPQEFNQTLKSFLVKRKLLNQR